MRGDPLDPKALPALGDAVVHALQLLAQHLQQLGAAHRAPVQLVRTGKNWRGHAVGHAPERHHHQLHEPLQRGAARARGVAAFQTLLQLPCGAAAGQNQMLDQLLRAPQPLVLPGMPLAPLRGPLGQRRRIGVENLLEDGMHGGAIEN